MGMRTEGRHSSGTTGVTRSKRPSTRRRRRLLLLATSGHVQWDMRRTAHRDMQRVRRKSAVSRPDLHKYGQQYSHKQLNVAASTITQSRGSEFVNNKYTSLFIITSSK